VKNSLIAFTLFLFSGSISAQYNSEDSTFSVIGNWLLNETINYSVLEEKFSIKEGDTINRERIQYNLEITIKDTSANSYKIGWRHQNYSVKSYDEFIEYLLGINENLEIIFKTDEFGAFQEVLNWDDIRKHFSKKLKHMKVQFNKIPKIKKIIRQYDIAFSRRESVLPTLTKHIRQFHQFHGAIYKLNEVTKGELKIPSVNRLDSFDTHSEVKMYSVDTINNLAVIQQFDFVDKKHGGDINFEIVKKIAESMGLDSIKREDTPDFSILDITTSTIGCNTAWIFLSDYIRITEYENTKEVETTNIKFLK
jgi:hypothetical protein